MKPLALVLVYITEEHRELVSQHFELIYAPNQDLGKDRTNGAVGHLVSGGTYANPTIS